MAFTGGGNTNTASGALSFTGGGTHNNASAVYTFCGGGQYNAASGLSSFIGGGTNLFARSYSKAAFGTFNTDYSPLSTSMILPGDRLFVIGNGIDNATRHNAITVLKNGKIGIGTDTPEQLLDVRGTNADDGALLILGNSDASHRMLFFSGRQNDPEPFIQWKDGDPLRFATDGGGFSEKMRITSDGNMGIGRPPVTNRLEVEGEASKSSAGDWIANSDARLKTNIRPLDSEEILHKMLDLQGITYEWNDQVTGSERPKGTMYGFTAQNIREVFPELVKEDNLGYLQTAYGTYDAMMVEAMRSLNRKVENQQVAIEDLQNENNQLKDLLNRQSGNIQLLMEAVSRLESALNSQSEALDRSMDED